MGVVETAVEIPEGVLGLSWEQLLALIGILSIIVSLFVVKPIRAFYEAKSEIISASEEIEQIKEALVLSDGTSLAESVHRLVIISESTAVTMVRLQDELINTNDRVWDLAKLITHKDSDE